MASQTFTQVTDDLDGSANASTVTFSYGGRELQIDLSKKNQAAFDKAVKPYIEAARSVRADSTRKATTRSRKSSPTDLGAVRAWATENGYEVSNRGRIAAAVVEAYQAAH
jgi:Lsr2